LQGTKKAEGFKYRLPDPVGRRDLEYYRDPAHRGYLSYLVGEGESPSLFFQTPEQSQKRVSEAKKTNDKELGSNRIW
jgi:large subunit ribosomal protein L15